MAQLLLLHLLAAALAPWLAKTLRTKAFPSPSRRRPPSCGCSPVSTDVRDGHPPTQCIAWVPGLGLDLDFRLDTLSWVLALLVTGVEPNCLYCTWYFHDDDLTLWRFTLVFTAFAGDMLGLVLTDNFLMLYVFWEPTTVLSYLLIGHNPASSTNVGDAGAARDDLRWTRDARRHHRDRGAPHLLDQRPARRSAARRRDRRRGGAAARRRSVEVGLIPFHFSGHGRWPPPPR